MIILTPREEEVLDYLMTNKEVTPRGALLDLDINSGSFTKRISELKAKGFPVNVSRRRNPNTGRLYAVYCFDWDDYIQQNLPECPCCDQIELDFN